MCYHDDHGNKTCYHDNHDYCGEAADDDVDVCVDGNCDYDNETCYQADDAEMLVAMTT